MKLLLIEDDASMQTALQRTLSRRGMEVSSCTDGRLALAQWSEAQPDVVVLDLSLPGLDGLQVLEQA
ncbi:MAG: response regulator, partial [Polaromonas sp.]